LLIFALLCTPRVIKNVFLSYSPIPDQDMPTKRSADTVPNMSDLMTIPDIDAHWKSIGARLHIKPDRLDEIEKIHGARASRCKREVIKDALRAGLTWKEMLDALSQLGLVSVVRKVCDIMELDYDGDFNKKKAQTVRGEKIQRHGVIRQPLLGLSRQIL